MFRQFSQPQLMGILNVTPDSFSDGGRFTLVDAAVAQVKQMLEEGVDIIDVGGESTRPGAEQVTAKEQIARVVPVILAIRQQLSKQVLISIDTTLADVAEAALDAGANIINDVAAGLADKNILTLAASRKVPIVLMHRQGESTTMQDSPHYTDVVAEVLGFLHDRTEAARQAGIDKELIAIDPGIGFGKRKQDNLDLLANLEKFVDTGYPVLLGASRKRFMGSICDVTEPSELVCATVATTVIGVMAGVQIFRVHDVKENKQAADVAWATKQASNAS